MSPQLILPAYTVPDKRRDRSRRLAILYRETVLLDDLEDGCFAGNEYFTKYTKCHPATVRDLAAELEQCSLVEREVLHGRERHIRPLVPLEVLVQQWRELAIVCSTCRRVSALVRAAAKAALKLVQGAMGRFTGALRNSKKAPAEASVSSEVRAFPAPKYAPLSFIQRGREDEKTAIQTPDPAQDAAVSLLVESTGISHSEAQSIAADPLVRTATRGLARVAIEHAVTCYQAARGRVQKPGAWLRSALRASDGYSAPVAPPTHPSELPAAPVARTFWIREEQLRRRPVSSPPASLESVTELSRCAEVGPGRATWEALRLGKRAH